MDRQGLYDPRHEHDACGVGFVADMHGRASRDIVDKGLQILQNIDHRGAAGAEKNTGDGTGILLQIPDSFYRTVMAEQGVTLPDAGAFATGIAFLPRRRMAMFDAKREIEAIAVEEGRRSSAGARSPSTPPAWAPWLLTPCPTSSRSSSPPASAPGSTWTG